MKQVAFEGQEEEGEARDHRHAINLGLAFAASVPVEPLVMLTVDARSAARAEETFLASRSERKQRRDASRRPSKPTTLPLNPI